ncbi:PREDICTED: uncharacterized protein LOC109353041 isoform X2 [Lupinus angustifolius]|nr:PREDICTED: uncharacterized protein LOC109353041 isoform X2 [Lupinus angustifolius]
MAYILKTQKEEQNQHINIYIPNPQPFSMPLSPSLMASIPQFYSNNTFSTTDITEFNSNTSVMDNTMWCEDNMNFIPVYDHYGALNNHHAVLQDWMPAISDCKMDEGGIGSYQNFSYGYQPHISDFDEDIKPPNNATQNWGIHGDQMPAGEESNNIKVERYSEEERKERILRYLKKRNQRNFNKTIKYACRKTLADRRVRVRGRFARNNNDLSAEDKATKNLENNNNHKEDLYGDHSIQFQLKINDDGDDWLYEAMASLVYLSHSSMDDI